MTPEVRTVLCVNDHIDDLGETHLETLLAPLPAWRRESVMRHKHHQGRVECAVGYIEFLRCMRLAFGISGTPAFAYGEHGKPFLPAHPTICFSISHCRHAVGCLVSDRPCGLDIERIRPVSESLLHHTMNPTEADCILSAEWPDLAFARLWTQKEAVLKLRGTGIVDDLHSVLDADKISDLFIQTVENPIRNYVLSTAIVCQNNLFDTF